MLCQFVNDTDKKYSEIKGWVDSLAARDGELQGFLDTSCRNKRDMTSYALRPLAIPHPAPCVLLV